MRPKSTPVACRKAATQIVQQCFQTSAQAIQKLAQEVDSWRTSE